MQSQEKPILVITKKEWWELPIGIVVLGIVTAVAGDFIYHAVSPKEEKTTSQVNAPSPSTQVPVQPTKNVEEPTTTNQTTVTSQPAEISTPSEQRAPQSPQTVITRNASEQSRLETDEPDIHQQARQIDSAMKPQSCSSELAVMRNGFTIRHERRELVGSTVRLYTTRDGLSYVDIPKQDMEHYECAPDAPTIQRSR